MAKTRVMVVDDEEHFLIIIKVNLQNTGRFEVMTLRRATDLVSKAQAFKPDIIFLDILMPHIDGFEACKMLKADPSTKDIPIIALTALDTDKDKNAMLKLGASSFLTKPIEKDELIAKIDNVLGFKKQ
ncbi:MAG: response regulator [Candidatus Omnitrophota bacterium]